MYWKSTDLRKLEAIRNRLRYHELQLDKQRDKLSKLYDKVYKENQIEKAKL